MEIQAAASGPAPAPSDRGVPEQRMYKNRLQQYAQSSGLPLPDYHIVNEGQQHEPRFRASVIVDGAKYESTQTFRQRKLAEQDVAKLALQAIENKPKHEGLPELSEDTVFCKSILYEFAVKVNRPLPSYTTSNSGGLITPFTSSLTFDGKTYVGKPAKSKKEAEQMAARAVILSILGDTSSRPLLSQIIKSKAKLYSALHKVSGPISHCGVSPAQSTMPFGSICNPYQLVSYEANVHNNMSGNKAVVVGPMVSCASLATAVNTVGCKKRKKKRNKKNQQEKRIRLAEQQVPRLPSCSIVASNVKGVTS